MVEQHGERWADGVPGGEHPTCKGREDRLRALAFQEQKVTEAGAWRRVAGGGMEAGTGRRL